MKRFLLLLVAIVPLAACAGGHSLPTTPTQPTAPATTTTGAAANPLLVTDTFMANGSTFEFRLTHAFVSGVGFFALTHAGVTRALPFSDALYLDGGWGILAQQDSGIIDPVFFLATSASAPANGDVIAIAYTTRP